MTLMGNDGLLSRRALGGRLNLFPPEAWFGGRYIVNLDYLLVRESGEGFFYFEDVHC